MGKDFIHPYMPNSVPGIKEEMLQELGIKSVKEIYESVIPEELRYKERLDLPEPILSEHELKKHVKGRSTQASLAPAATSTRCRRCAMRSTPEENFSPDTAGTLTLITGKCRPSLSMPV